MLADALRPRVGGNAAKGSTKVDAMKRVLLAILLLGLPIVALAQQQAPPPVGNFWYDNAATPPLWRPASTAYPIPVAATASISGFAPALAYGTLTATGSSSASTALPTNTGTVTLFNTGTTAVSCTFASGAATASASQNVIAANSGQPFYVTYGATTYDHVACIDQTGSASNVVVLSGGTGLATGWGGGGGSGGGLAVTDNTAFTYGASQLTPIGGVYNSSITACTSGNQCALALDINRSAFVNVQTGSTLYNLMTSGTATTGSPVPASAIYFGVNVGGNLVGMAPGTAGTASTQVWTVQGAASMTPLLSQTQAATSGGWTPKWIVAANSDNSTNLKGSAGIVHAVQVFGIGAAPAWLKFYDKATAPTCASDTIVKQIMIPANSTAALGAGAISTVIDTQFSTGIGYCVVTGIGATDDTSVAAATFVVNIDWK